MEHFIDIEDILFVSNWTQFWMATSIGLMLFIILKIWPDFIEQIIGKTLGLILLILTFLCLLPALQVLCILWLSSVMMFFVIGSIAAGIFWLIKLFKKK